jgi:hypothetical protein
MAINSTNINKTNNHLSPKVSLNSDGHQFHQYEENEQSHLNFTHWAQKDHDIWRWKSKSWKVI